MKTEHKIDPATGSAYGSECTCGECSAEDLAVDPFVALRVSQGMLLGVDDFHVLMGNPRGKHMLHQAWLHGSGVVWGLGVKPHGRHELTVRPGLAVDGLGRELVLTGSTTVDIADWLRDNDPDYGVRDCGTRKLRACLVAEFVCRTAEPVPVLADPCDVTRRSDQASRIVETASVRLLPERCHPCRTPYHRLRVLFGLEPVGTDDPAGEEAAEARADVLAHPPSRRPAVMARHLRCLAAADAAELCPDTDEGGEVTTPFPVTEPNARVVLACVTVKVRDDTGCTTVEKVNLDDCCRCVLLPTHTIQDLLAGMATCLAGPKSRHHHPEDPGAGEGPRVVAHKVRWEKHGARLVIPVTGELAPGSLRRGVTITSLAAKGWSTADIETVTYDADGTRIVVDLDEPVDGVVRVVVKGTGPTPVFGLHPIAPLAGVVGGPPVAPGDGHDAVITFAEGLRKGEAS